MGALAERALQQRMSETVAGLRHEIADMRGDYSALQQQSGAFSGMIPMLADGARSSINNILQKQVRTQPCAARTAYARRRC